MKKLEIKKLEINKERALTIALNVGVAAAVILVPTVVEAITGIEAGGRRIHGTIVTVGKWVIVVKGSIDCVQSVLNGDVGKAKQQFFAYLLCFGIMLALPWGLDEVEALFK